MRMFAIAALALLMASLLVAANEMHRVPAPWASRSFAAQQLFLDPVTGLPRAPTEAELAALRIAATGNTKAALRLGSGILEEVHLPDGTGAIRLDPASFHAVQVCLKDGDGPAVECSGPQP